MTVARSQVSRWICVDLRPTSPAALREPDMIRHDAIRPANAADVNQKLVDQYTEIARLAGGLAHEIKNPLSTIRLNMELLAEDFRDERFAARSPGDAEDRAGAARVPAAARPAGRLPQFRQGAPAEARAERPERRRSCRSWTSSAPRPQEARIEVVDYLSSDLATVLLDRESFHGALLNLVLNAQQAMPEGGQLVVRTYDTAAGRGVGPDRHRLRHGRARRRPTPSTPSFPRSAAVPAWGCPRRGRSSRPTAGRSPCRASWAAARSSRSSCRSPPACPPRTQGIRDWGLGIRGKDEG